MSDGERRTVTTSADCDLEVKPSRIQTTIQDLNHLPVRRNELEEIRMFEQSEEMREYEEMEEMDYALVNDKKDLFLRLIKSPRFDTDKVGLDIIIEDAVKCAAAVLAGETNGIISPDFELSSVGGWTLLHECAAHFSLKIMTLLLHMGFSADAKADWESKSFILKQQLPLNVALAKLKFRCTHSIGFLDCQNRSAARLLMELCFKKIVLETVRLLALNTREFKHEFYNYVKEGKMVEVGALLLAAGEKLLPLCISEGEDVLVFNSFKEIGYFLQAKNTWSAMSNDELTEMKRTLLLLDIYDKIGNQLSAYVRLKEKRPLRTAVLEVATLLEDASFDVKIEDLYFQDWAYRVESPLFERRILQICAKQEDDGFFFKGNVVPDWMNQNLRSLPFCSKSRQPSIPTRPSRNLFHTSSFRNTDSKCASLTLAKKMVIFLQNLNSCERWVSFMMILRRGVRRM